jgi:predicted  nucleic acid-binding Zn-ribbon protein
MADEQVIIDIKVESEDIKTADKRIDQLTDSIEELGNRIKQAREQNKQYKKSQEELVNEYKAGKISVDQLNDGVDAINKKIKINNRVIGESQVELSKLKSERNANIKLIKSETNSLAQLEARASLLNKQITKQSKATKEGREEFNKLEKELGEVNKAINEQRKSFNDYTKNIGNYPEAASGAIISIDQLGDGLEKVGGASATAVGGIKSIGGAFKALLANPIVLLIATIVTGLKFLFDAFKKSASGSRLLGKASAALRGIFALVTRAADKLGKFLEKVWDDPKKAVQSLGDEIEKNLSKRWEGLKETFKGIGDQITATFEGDNKKLRESAKKTQEAFDKLGSGFDRDELEEYAKQELIAEKRAEKLAGAFVRLDEVQRGVRASTRDLQKNIAALNAEFEKQSQIAGDDTRSLEEQRAAAIKAAEVQAALGSQEVELAKKRRDLIAVEVKIRDAAGEDIQDILDDLADAEVEYTEARSRAAMSQRGILIEQAKIERDIFEQNLDILIDIGDKIKTEQEKAIQDESKTLEERKMLLNASRAALTANFDEIKKEYELYGVTVEEINDVINASDAKQTNERLKALGINEIATNRLREIILERRQAELDFNDLQNDLVTEEVTRRQDANEIIREIEEEREIEQIENAEELKERLIEIEQEKLALQLENETLLAEEREALTLQTEEAIRDIEEEFSQKRKKSIESNVDFVADSLSKITEITREFAGTEAALFGELTANITKVFQDGQLTATEALTGILTVSNSVFASIAEGRDQDLQNNENARKRELELAGDNAEAQAKINEEYDRKQAAIKLKQFKSDKTAAILNIGIQTALGIIKTIGSVGFPVAIPLIAAIGAIGIANTALVASKQPPKFAGGTNDIVSIGGSHASGNDVDVWGFSGGSKQYFGKVERGEAMPVIRKSAMNDYMVAKLNGRFNPKNGRKFQDGTPDITQPVQQESNQSLVNDIITAFSSVQIVTKIEDITKEAGKKAEIVSNSKV